MKTIVLTFCGFLAYQAVAANNRPGLTGINHDGSLSVRPLAHANTVAGVLNHIVDNVNQQLDESDMGGNEDVVNDFADCGCGGDICDDICGEALLHPHDKTLNAHLVTSHDTIIP